MNGFDVRREKERVMQKLKEINIQIDDAILGNASKQEVLRYLVMSKSIQAKLSVLG